MCRMVVRSIDSKSPLRMVFISVILFLVSVGSVGAVTGLVANYSFDGDVKDHSGNGNDGTVNGATYVLGVSGQALEFDGINDYIEIPDENSLDLEGPFTIEAWVKPYEKALEPTGHIALDIIEKRNGRGAADSNYEFQIYSGRGNKPKNLVCVIGDGTHSSSVRADMEVNYNKWNYVNCVYNETHLNLYLDGDLIKSGGKGIYDYLGNLVDPNNIVSPKANTAELTVGALNYSGTFIEFFNGTIDEVKIYNRALLASEIQANYDAILNPTSTSTTTTTTTTTTTSTTLVSTITPIRITNEPGNEFVPDQSNDGQYIVMKSNRDGGTYNIWRMNSEGGNFVKLTNMPSQRSAWNPVFHPDGKYVYYMDNSPSGADFHWFSRTLTDGTGGREQILLIPGGEGGGRLSFSPDGSQFAYHHNGYDENGVRYGRHDLKISNSDGSNLKSIYRNDRIRGDVAWSPDGTRIYFSMISDGTLSLYSIGINGQYLTRLMNAFLGDSSQPAVSPDGEKIAFQNRKNSISDSELYLMSSDGSNIMRITENNFEDVSPTWSYDGNMIIYSSNADGDYDLYAITLTPTTTTTPPAATTDLTISETTANSITLAWTAPGDDGNTGTASQYDIRYSTSPITEANWDSATHATGEPAPKPAGSSESFMVTGLTTGTTYYFALKTGDEVPNWSGLSNVVSGTTAEIPVSEQPQLKAPWEGTEKISQGNFGSKSHNVCGQRQIDPKNCDWENTYALDIALFKGTDVLAPAKGVVIYVDSVGSGDGGKELAINHTGGPTDKNITTVYLHLDKILVKKGEVVKQGQVIAKSGNTGGVDPHLHFHIWKPKYKADGSPAWKYDSHTIPIERLVMRNQSEDDFREYDARKGELDDSKIAWKYFKSNNHRPPIADAGEDHSVSSGYLVYFDGSDSYDPDDDGQIVSYIWDFGDGTTAEGEKVSHRFRGAQNEPKTYDVSLTVEDNNGSTDTDTVDITVAPLKKSVEVSKSPFFAKLTVTYNWIEKNGGGDIYIISKNNVEASGFFGTFVPTIWVWENLYPLGEVSTIEFLDYLFVRGSRTEKTYEPPFKAKSIGTSPPIATRTFDDGTFKGIQVKDLDMMSIYAQGLSLKWSLPPIEAELFEFSATTFNPLAPPAEPGLIEKLLDKLLDLVVGKLGSPGELRFYDSEGRVTGLVNGEVREEIPNSVYFNNTVMILSPSNSYRYEVAGTDNGTYGLTLISVEEGNATTFTAIDIPTSPNATHRYSVNWTALSQGGEGVTVQIDSDGDGTFEQNITSDGELTQDEFILQTETTIDIDPDSLNLKSHKMMHHGRWITAYIELPEGYNVTDINVSTLLLNDTISAKLHPSDIGDYDNDGIPDLMVKFDRGDVVDMVKALNLDLPAGVELAVTGTLTDGTQFKGSDTIRVIEKGRHMMQKRGR